MQPARSAAADVNPRSEVRTIDRLRQSVLVVTALACAGLASACGSSASSSSPGSSGVATTCNKVGAVLSDGPDPGADPVGYAEAQILPLRQIHTSDETLQSAIDNLASADEQVSSSNWAAAANHAATRAANKVNAICPGAAS